MSDEVKITRQCPVCTPVTCCICKGVNESCLDQPSHPGPSKDAKRIKELEGERDRLKAELEDAQRVRAEVLAATYWDDGPDREEVPTWEIRDIFERADRRLDKRMAGNARTEEAGDAH